MEEFINKIIDPSVSLSGWGVTAIVVICTCIFSIVKYFKKDQTSKKSKTQKIEVGSKAELNQEIDPNHSGEYSEISQEVKAGDNAKINQKC